MGESVILLRDTKRRHKGQVVSKWRHTPRYLSTRLVDIIKPHYHIPQPTSLPTVSIFTFAIEY